MRTCHNALCEAGNCSMLFHGLECRDESDPKTCQFVLFHKLVLHFCYACAVYHASDVTCLVLVINIDIAFVVHFQVTMNTPVG